MLTELEQIITTTSNIARAELVIIVFEAIIFVMNVAIVLKIKKEKEN